MIGGTDSRRPAAFRCVVGCDASDAPSRDRAQSPQGSSGPPPAGAGLAAYEPVAGPTHLTDSIKRHQSSPGPESRPNLASASRTPRLSVLLVRHGVTDSNTAGVIQGHLPIPLNALGRAQAECVAGRLARWDPPVDALVSSDLVRAAQTADAIAAACGIAVRADARWRERSLGSAEGRDVGIAGIWSAATGGLHVHDAEPIDALRSRVIDAIRSVPVEFPHARCVAVVTHGGPLRILLEALLDGRLASDPAHPVPAIDRIANAAVFHLLAPDSRHRFWSLLSANDTAHLTQITEE